jgi:hypothetical protein
MPLAIHAPAARHYGERVKIITNSAKRRSIQEVDQNGDPVGNAFDAHITRAADGPASDRDYIATAEKMENCNWRDDDSLSFAKSGDMMPPQPDGIKTVIKTTADGRVWLAGPNMQGPLDLTSAAACAVQTDGIPVPLFETGTKQDKLSSQQMGDINAIQSKANAIDLAAHASNGILHVSPADRAGWNGKAEAADIATHVGNATPHVSPADRINWNSKADASDMNAHAGNAAPHVSSAERTNWNGKADASDVAAHVGNATPHVSPADRTSWNGKADAADLISHRDNKAIHITSNERTSWNGRVQGVTAANVVYGKDAGGAASNRSVSASAAANHIVQRNASGQIAVPTAPAAASDAASKQYVDSKRPKFVTRCITQNMVVANGWKDLTATAGGTVLTTSNLTNYIDVDSIIEIVFTTGTNAPTLQEPIPSGIFSGSIVLSARILRDLHILGEISFPVKTWDNGGIYMFRIDATDSTPGSNLHGILGYKNNALNWYDVSDKWTLLIREMVL